MASRRLIALNREQEALDLAQRLAEGDRTDARPLLWKAIIQQAFNRDEAAIASYQAAIKINPKDIEPYLEATRLLYRQDNNQAAIKLLNDAIARADKPAAAYRYLADLYQKQSAATKGFSSRRYRGKAIAVLQRADKAGYANHTVHWHLARLLTAAGDVEKAIPHFIEAEQLDPDNVTLKDKLAKSLSTAAGGPKPAVKALEKYTRKHPDNGHAWYYLGCIYELDEQPLSARQAFDTASEMQPVHSSAYWKAALHAVEHSLSEARHKLLEGLKKLPGDARLTEMLAFIYLQEKQYDLAVEHFERVDAILTEKGINEQAEKFHYNFALAGQGAGEIDIASHHLTLALKSNIKLLPSFALQVTKLETPDPLHTGLQTLEATAASLPAPEVYHYIAMFHRFTDNYIEAEKAFSKAEQLAAGHEREKQILDASFYYMFGNTCDKIGNQAKSELLLERCIELAPDHARALNHLAYAWSERGVRLSEALDHIETALEIEPDNGAFLDTRGWIFYQKGNYDAALADLLLAHEKYPEDPTILNHLGDTYAALNQYERAEERWEAALEFAPENAEILRKISELPTTR